MQLGLVVRTMGPASSRETVLACAKAGEAAGVDDLYVVDHVAIPPDDAEGSNGRYLDPLATLGVLAGATARVGLGTAVLILPYRPALPTAKQIATLQELSGGRLRLGVGIGWMEPEFRALGVPRARRGAIADETLAFLRRCFDEAGADDVVEANGQPFLFRPRPKAPPIYVGGAGPHALARALRYGDGWMPMAASAEKLREPIAALQRLAREAGRAPLAVVAMGRLALDDAPRARDELAALAALGVSQFVHAERYADAAGFARCADALVALRG